MTVLLRDLTSSKRAGATVIHEGEQLAVWSYCTRGPVWLWRPEDASLVEVPELVAGQLHLVEAHSIYRDGARDCTRRNHRAAEPAATECPSRGLAIGTLA